MRKHSISVVDGLSLSDECKKGFFGVSLHVLAHGRPEAVYLWQEKGCGLKVQCEMHDIGDRLEVGSLVISKVTDHNRGPIFYSLPAAFLSGFRLEKLLYIDQNSEVESGLVMTADDNEVLYVVSGAFPYTVEVSVTLGTPFGFDPEYPISSYKRERII